jgi:hypothetical protein
VVMRKEESDLVFYILHSGFWLLNFKIRNSKFEISSPMRLALRALRSALYIPTPPTGVWQSGHRPFLMA